MKLSKPLIALSLSVFAAGCSSEDDPSSSTETKTTLTDVARANGNFTTLVGALEATGLDMALEGDGPFTVMAPTDEAFARLPDGVVESLDAATLEKILKYHVVAGEARAEDVVTMTSATTLEGDSFSISAGADGVFLNAATEVVQTDVLADNGVIHVIDSVLLPPDLAFPGTLVDAVSAYPAFDTLVGAVASAELVGALEGANDGKGFTLFAPTNAAFDALGADLSTLGQEVLSSVLLYHVVGNTVDASTVVGLTSAPTLEGSPIAVSVAGGGVTLDGDVQVVRTDLRASNGIIHVVDGVLTPEN
jgi:uncharacterized surface protein with fasciclin (FAS1) repeats